MPPFITRCSYPNRYITLFSPGATILTDMWSIFTRCNYPNRYVTFSRRCYPNRFFSPQLSLQICQLLLPGAVILTDISTFLPDAVILTDMLPFLTRRIYSNRNVPFMPDVVILTDMSSLKTEQMCQNFLWNYKCLLEQSCIIIWYVPQSVWLHCVHWKEVFLCLLKALDIRGIITGETKYFVLDTNICKYTVRIYRPSR